MEVSNMLKKIIAPLFLLMLSSCDSSNTDENELIGKWTTECLDGWVGSIDFINDNTASDTETEYSNNNCTGTPDWEFEGEFTYSLGGIFYTDDNIEAIELDIFYDDGGIRYTLILMDGTGTFYLGKTAGENNGSHPDKRRSMVNYDVAWYRN